MGEGGAEKRSLTNPALGEGGARGRTSFFGGGSSLLASKNRWPERGAITSWRGHVEASLFFRLVQSATTSHKEKRHHDSLRGMKPKEGSNSIPARGGGRVAFLRGKEEWPEFFSSDGATSR